MCNSRNACGAHDTWAQFTSLAWMVVVLLCSGLTVPTFAYTFSQVGVTGGLVIHEGKVYFGQADFSMTALDLESGEVITRKKCPWFARSLLLTDSGILVESSQGIALLDFVTLDVIRMHTHQEIMYPRASSQGELVPDEIPVRDPETAFTRFDVIGGSLIMRPAAICRKVHIVEGDRPLMIGLESEDHKWTGTLPYLPSPGIVFAVGSTADRIVLGSNLGHVECLDAATGKSLWMYLFPTIRHTMSYSSRGLPPYMATAAAIHKARIGLQSRHPADARR